MSNIVPDLLICFILLLSFLVIHFSSDLFSLNGTVDNGNTAQNTESSSFASFLKLFVNGFGYTCIFIPLFVIYKYTKTINYFERCDKTLVYYAVQACFNGSSNSDSEKTEGNGSTRSQSSSNKRVSSTKDIFLLSYCFVGLMVSYLTWGILQEKIMTQEYESITGTKEKFSDSQFLVFSNRFLAFLVSFVYLLVTSNFRQKAPLYKYSYASFSNIMSAWFQYEALKYVNFPTQVLAKSCKIIPVMLMGKLVSKSKYEFYEYLTASLISLGMIFFLFGNGDSSKSSSVVTITGILFLVMYLVFDSFTSNWQSDLFRTYSMTSIQMMCGVNLFSTILTLSSLFIQEDFMQSLVFAVQHQKFIVDCVILSISSAVGQLYIFYTISIFGPVVFTIIMTLRQVVAIILSCLIYKHSISALSAVGVVIVFIAIFLKVYCNQRIKRKTLARIESSKPKVNV